MADEPTSFRTDYAASDRSTCNRCRQNIRLGDLRIGPMVQSPKGDFKYPQWHHFSCFEDGYLKKHKDAFKDLPTVKGLDALKFEDQKRIKSLVVAGDSSVELKPVNGEEKQLAADNKLIWARKEKLEELSNPELVEMLEHNNQPAHGPLFGGRNKMIERISDGMVFGALPKCPLCGNGDFRLSGGVYHCTGAADEFARCENVKASKDLDRTPWKVPPSLALQYAFLQSYKYKEREKCAAVIHAVAPQPAQPAAPQKSAGKASGKKRKRGSDELAEPVAPAAAQAAAAGAAALSGSSVMFAGKLSKAQSALAEIVTSNGGIVAARANQATICVCTEAETTKKGSAKGKEAVNAGVLCVSEAWLERCVKAGRRLAGSELEPFILANAPKIDEERLKRQKIAEKIEKKSGGATDKSQFVVPQATGKSQTKKLVVKGSAAVEPDSGLVDEAHVYEPKMGEVFSSVMNLADVSTGQNSFYILQLLEHDGRNRYSVFRKWGKVGCDAIGGTKVTGYAAVSGALQEFKKVFFEKTANNWDDWKNFKRVYGKFIPSRSTTRRRETRPAGRRCRPGIIKARWPAPRRSSSHSFLTFKR